MTIPEEDDEIARTVNALLKHAENAESLKTAANAALRLFHSMRYRRGYADAMDDAKLRKDRRVSVHFN